MVLDSLGPADPLREEVTEIVKAGERATLLTKHLLAFSRKQMLQVEIFDLNTIINRTRKILNRLIGEAIELAIHLEPDIESIKADPSQIEQVILNLAINARDAMPQGGTLKLQTRNVSLGSKHVREHPEIKPGPYVELMVQDTGKGMPAGDIVHIFEPFLSGSPCRTSFILARNCLMRKGFCTKLMFWGNIPYWARVLAA